MTIQTLPLTTNRLYRGRRFLTQAGKDNKDALAWEARAQWRGAPLQGPVAIDIQIFWPDRRRHDVDNLKGLLDAFSGIVYGDDSQVVDLRVRKGIDAKNPRIEVKAEPVGQTGATPEQEAA